MKKRVLYSVMASLFLVGCGGGSSSSYEKTKEVKAIDAYIVGAKICDLKGNCGITDANGVARAAFDLNTTLTSIGGFIDANGNGIKDSSELEAPTLLAPANATVVTPLTTLVAKGADVNKLASVLGVKPDEILHTDPIETNNLKLVKAINAVYPVIKENRVAQLVEKVNSFKTASSSATDLPVFDAPVEVNIFYLSKSVVTDYKDKKFIDEVQDAYSYDAKSLSFKLENIKANMDNLVSKPEVKAEVTEKKPIEKDKDISETSKPISTDINTTTPTTELETPKRTEDKSPVVSSKTELPDFDSDTTPTTIPLKSPKTDLPEIDSDDVKLIPTKDSYNPTYTPLPKRYFVRLDNFNDFVEVKKIDEKNYEFLNEKYFNVSTTTFNPKQFFDINASYIFNDLNFSPDGNLNGTIFLSLKDLNSSSEFNLTKTAVFRVVDGKVLNTTISSTTFKKFDIRLSSFLPAAVSSFNKVNHDYKFKIEYNVSDNILSLSGKYGVIKAVVPKISLKDTSFIVPKNLDVNISIGTSNVANVNCEVSGIDLKCYVDNTKTIYLYGHTPDIEAIKVPTITLNNRGYKTSKSFYLEILKPADKVIIKNWDITTPYTGHHIDMKLTGSLSNNILTVNTSTNPITGSPENNVTVYLFNSSSDTANRVKFVFDANVYKSNDWFIVRRKDGKEVKFRVGDIDISNNTFYFK